MPARPDTPRDLLFGLLALQTGLIDQSALVAAFHAWTRAEGRPMAAILVERGDLGEGQRALIDGLASEHLKRHGGDPERSLAALAAGPSTRDRLAAIRDPDLGASLARVGTALPVDADPFRTASHAIGTATSDGQRFRVLRPHARGGLGAVFVALDGELNREVALKQILDDHAYDPDSRSRFLVEAEITGGLEHPGIVPVYGLGHDPEGRPYYAMRFIRGDSLKEAIAAFHGDEGLKSDPGRRSLALRKLLRRFVDVCNAIEYAHSRGVLHRDLKPGNIIVGKHGETLVVDWGLAKATGPAKAMGQAEPSTLADERHLQPSSASGSSETLPGAAVGTPAYMSPEQAIGDLGRLGPRSDVYSLGATLYSLLTGRPPFEGRDLGVMLRAVQKGEFPPPRATDPTIDPALEATCLRAMATDPDSRYPSPKSLADDLERWSADEPVSAYPEPFARRARRWARRHRTAVTAASVGTLAALLGLAGVLAVQSRANRDLNLKNGELTRANQREMKANADLKAAGEQVQARFDLAQESIRTFQATVTEDEILKDERFRPLRDKLLRSAAEFYGKLGVLLEGRTDRRSLLALARAYNDLGALTGKIGAKPEALAAFRKELSARRELVQSRNPGELFRLAECLISIGKLASETGANEEARSNWVEAARILSAESWPMDITNLADSLLARSHNNIGTILWGTGDAAGALWSHREALAALRRLADANPAVTEFQSDLASSHNNIGYLLGETGDAAGALASHREALAIRARLADANPAATGFQSDLAMSHGHIGYLLGETGDAAGGLASHREALAALRRLADANPAVTEFQSDLALSHNNIGYLLGETGDAAGALASHREALAIRARLADANPAVTEFQSDLASSHNNIGTILWGTGEAAGALWSYREALAIRARLADANPAATSFQSGLASSHNNIGTILGGTGDAAGALASHREALAIRARLADANRAIPAYQRDFYNSLAAVGRDTTELGRAVEAVTSLKQAIAMEGRLPRGPDTLYDQACCHSLLVGVATLPGSGLSDEEARSEGDQALRLLKRAVSAGYRNLGLMRRDKNLDPIRHRADFQALLMDLAFPASPFAGQGGR